MSIIIPLKHMMPTSVKHSATDPQIVKDVKSAIASNLEEKYSDPRQKSCKDLQQVSEGVQLYSKARVIQWTFSGRWTDDEHRYGTHTFSGPAKRYLVVKAASVPSERAISTAGDVVNTQRSAVSPGNVDLLVFSKRSLREWGGLGLPCGLALPHQRVVDGLLDVFGFLDEMRRSCRWFEHIKSSSAARPAKSSRLGIWRPLISPVGLDLAETLVVVAASSCWKYGISRTPLTLRVSTFLAKGALSTLLQLMDGTGLGGGGGRNAHITLCQAVFTPNQRSGPFSRSEITLLQQYGKTLQLHRGSLGPMDQLWKLHFNLWLIFAHHT
ncbi:hypothetical protein N1851_012988 [Merluccius polli]|uniref:HAT C-terminal dimerisation domain-containing protein n=1 Tax=Merluccius polli TaxID=89951 RepID=A0AA47MVS9_MERPO|nr:hypothetical protein N1851_012988 [Merluccius polli]